MLELRNITRTYELGGERAGVFGVSLTVSAGTVAALAGPSGSGKTTLLQVAGLLDLPDEGEVRLEGRVISNLPERERCAVRLERLGFVFQAFNLVPTLTAGENIVLPLSLAGRRPDAAWLETVIDTVGLRDRLAHRPAELSGGQQQRVAVARALASRPELVFADEPTGNLDSRSAAQLLSFLRHAVDAFGQTVVMVTHDPAAAAHADRVVFLSDGRVVDELEAPSAERVLDRMKAFGD